MEITEERAEALLKRAISEAKASGIPVSKRLSTQIRKNTRAKKRLAACKKKGKDFYIEINEKLLSGKISEEKIREILAHEVLHTCRGCFDHGEKWKAYARRMNEDWGYHISRTARFEDLGLKEPETKEPFRYIIRCEKCGKEIKRRRRSRLVTRTRDYRCLCGGKLRLIETEEKGAAR